MKRTTLLIFLALPLLLVAVAAAAMTADEVINKSLEAQGGRDAIKAVQSIKATGRFLTMGMEFPFTMTQARPNKMRIDADINGMKMVQVWAGDSGWSINPMMGSMEPQDMGPVEAKSYKLQSDMDGVLMDYAKKGYTVEYVGEDEVEGTAVHHLKLDTHDDLVLDMYFDAEHFLLIKQTSKMTMDDQVVESDTYMSDFKEAGDLLVPYSMETRMGGQTMNNIVLDTIEYGVPVEDGMFEKPAGK